VKLGMKVERVGVVCMGQLSRLELRRQDNASRSF
jgi:hypothetical protein